MGPKKKKHKKIMKKKYFAKYSALQWGDYIEINLQVKINNYKLRKKKIDSDYKD